MYRFASWATLCMCRFATGVPELYAGLLCVHTGSLQAYLNIMLGYFVCTGSLQAYLNDMLGYFVYVQVRYSRT